MASDCNCKQCKEIGIGVYLLGVISGGVLGVVIVLAWLVYIALNME